MPLVVEDGTGVVGANTYADIATVRAHAAERGITLQADDTDLTATVYEAMEVIEAYEDRMRGSRVDVEQALAYPRKNVVLSNGFPVAENVVPSALIMAITILSGEVAAGNSLQPTTDGRAVIESTAGPATVRWATPEQGGGNGQSLHFRRFMNTLAPLLRGSASQMRTLRV